MGKTIKRVLLFIIILGILYGAVTGKFTTIFEIYESTTDKFIYTDEYRVNNLQYDSETLYYNTLTDNQKKVYSAIAKGIKELKNEIIVGKYEFNDIGEASEDTKNAINAFLCDHPEVFYLNSKYIVAVTNSFFGKILKIQLDYSVSDLNELNEKINDIETVIYSIISKIESLSEYEKELYVHDYLATYIRYYGEYENESLDKYHSAYTALIEKNAVCDGISKAYQLVLNKLGIDNYLVTGFVNDTAHAWNIVNIENEWVYVDITSDKFIKDDDGNTIEAVHTYFNVNKEFILKNHKIDNEELLPSSTSTEKTYYAKNNSVITVSQDFNKRIDEIFDVQNDRKIVEFSTNIQFNVPEKLVKKLQSMKFNKLKTEGNKVSMTYYNEQNVYIIPKI